MTQLLEKYKANKGPKRSDRQLRIERQRRISTRAKRAVISLFAGAGGLDVGLEAAGFSISICVEVDEDARQTLRTNRPYWRLSEPGDILQIAPSEILAQAGLQPGEVTLLAGGPPCQPFSKSAYWSNGETRGLGDPRAGSLSAYLEVVEVALPRVLLLENVRGLATNGEAGSGLDFLRCGLERVNRRLGTDYQIQVVHLNAASYGVPQFRERIFILACIDGQKLEIPKPTHGDEAKLHPFRNAWDAIGDLDTLDSSPDLQPTGKWAALLKSIPEGRNYLWHTRRGLGEPLFGWRTRYWSFLLKLAKRQPSWTIQAEPGPATGPFHWRNRLLSIQELARLQTFPRVYQIIGTRRSAHRQVGNAVPCAIGELLGLEIRRQLLGERRVRQRLKLIPDQRGNEPSEYPAQPVPAEFLSMRGKHPDHPGRGLGPGRVWSSSLSSEEVRH